jgi:SpoIID/LytB domain protein
MMRRALITACLLALPLGVLPSTALAADEPESAVPRGPNDTFHWFGAGWGHALGMSQYGAYGLAQDGWGANKILTHFYSSTNVSADSSPPKTLRIGLVQGQDAVHLEAQEGPVEIRLGDPEDGDVVGTIPDGESWKVSAVGSDYRIVDESGATVDRVGGPNNPIFAVFEDLGARVRVPDAGHTYNRGFIEFGLYDCDDDDCVERLNLVVEPQGYLYGLAEVPSSWPMAALKTQAIAARSYAFSKAALSQHRSVCDCALYASSYDQVFAGWDKEGGVDGDRWVSAVNQTKDEVVKHQGDVIQAFYMSSSGGYTENNENVWGGAPIEYLRGVCDPGDYTSANPNATWEVTTTATEVTKDLGLGIGGVTGFTDIVRGVSGRILSLTVKGETGQALVSGNSLQSALGLRDDRVWINTNKLVTGEIREKYDAIGCSPGLATSKQVAVSGGLRQKFERATIYFSGATGAHDLSGPVLERYKDEGGPGGPLGFPTTDVEVLAGGRERATFEHGTITCQPDGSSCTVA